MKKKQAPPRATAGILLMSILFLYLFIIGLSISITVIEDWYLRPNYITDETFSFFSGSLFLSIALFLIVLTSQQPQNHFLKRYGYRISLFFFFLAFAWSVCMVCLRFATMSFYEDNRQFGVCVQEGRHRTLMYVKDTDWCDRHERKIKYLSPIVNKDE